MERAPCSLLPQYLLSWWATYTRPVMGPWCRISMRGTDSPFVHHETADLFEMFAYSSKTR